MSRRPGGRPRRRPGLLLGCPDELAGCWPSTSGLPAAAVAAELVPAQAALLDALTAAADGELREAGALRTAVVQAQPAAALVVTGVAADLLLP